jgi:DNA-binding LytR/AlgR family response regulator
MIITYHLLKWYNQYLVNPCFFRCHNSYIINCLFVDYYNRQYITLKNSTKIPLSRTKIKLFKINLKDLYNETTV